MMVGNNELLINQATMIEAMQAYIDAQMTPAPKVISVGKTDYDGGFTVKLGDKEAANESS